MTHRQAVWLMVGITFLWGTAGVVTRHLEAARSFEVTFWRSLFNAAFLVVAVAVLQRRWIGRGLLRAGWPLWVSGLCWSLMYTCFMVAITMTTVANVLVTMSIVPLVTALLAWAVLGQRVDARTWAAIVVAGMGIAWMYAREIVADPAHLAGTLVATVVPLAAAVNWLVMQQHGRGRGRNVDLLPAIFIGASLSALYTLPLAWPLQAGGRDIALLAGLGVFQLAVPCILLLRVAQVLPAPEVALLALLEVLFGVALTWLGAGEVPGGAVLLGGGLVLGALAFHQSAGILPGLLRLQTRRRGEHHDGPAGTG